MIVLPCAASNMPLVKLCNQVCLQQGAVDRLGESILCITAQSHNLVVILMTLRFSTVHAAELTALHCEEVAQLCCPCAGGLSELCLCTGLLLAGATAGPWPWCWALNMRGKPDCKRVYTGPATKDDVTTLEAPKIPYAVQLCRWTSAGFLTPRLASLAPAGSARWHLVPPALSNSSVAESRMPATALPRRPRLQ
jgi:hypothetical protein